MERKQRHSLVICASLVENPMNLGALCRTTEIFNLELLVLPRLEVAQTREFRKLAVSAHHWQPMEACSQDNLLAWINNREQAGYVPLALTPHSPSHSLTEFQFPPKSLLVLGRELTGIPAAILEKCQGAIAIPQFGHVESLNVQTAAAIAIYEYVKQYSVSHNSG